MQWWQLNQGVQTKQKTKQKTKKGRKEKEKREEKMGKLPWSSVLKKEICIINSKSHPLT